MPAKRACEEASSSVDDDDYGNEFYEVGSGEGGLQSVARLYRTPYNLLGMFNDVREAEIMRDGRNRFKYLFHDRYGKVKAATGTVGTRYRFVSHGSCSKGRGHMMKITVSRGIGRDIVKLSETGEHGGEELPTTEHGIPLVIKDEIDGMPCLGLSASKTRNLLQFKYLVKPEMLRAVQTIRQMENRKALLKDNFVGNWEFETFAEVYEWAAGRMCQTREDYGDSSDSDEDLHATLVLDTFQHHYVDENGTEAVSIGLVMTSRMLFDNVQRAALDQCEELTISTDGTYKIHFGGWVLVDIGSESVEYVNGEYVHRFRPWAYMFVRSECSFAYEQLFRAMVTAAKLFFYIDIVPAIVSIDHSSAIAGAIETVWPESTIITCWPHLIRNCRKHTNLLEDKNAYENGIKDQIYNLHHARSHEQFQAMATVTVSHWEDVCEIKFASWFKNVYLPPRWSHWHVNVSSIAGVLPNQQAIETHHSTIIASHRRTCEPQRQLS